MHGAENFIPVILGQEFADLLAKAMSMSKKVFKGWRDQEAWMVTGHLPRHRAQIRGVPFHG